MHCFWIQEVSLPGDHAIKEFKQIPKDLEADLYYALREFVITLTALAKTALLVFMRLTTVNKFFRCKYTLS